MRFASEHRTSMALSDKLRVAHDVTPELMTEILDVMCRRVALPGNSAKAQRLKELIKARACTDTALALLELELPLWHIRRIAYEAGEWHCALSRQRELPDWLDQSIEAKHPNLALALLIALVEAQRATAASNTSVPAALGKLRSDYIPFCCDNFS